MTDRFRVLSVDFDFFQNVTAQQLSCYPDGIDRPTEQTEQIWNKIYENNDATHIRKVRLATTLYGKLIRILLKQNQNTPIMFANSHIHTYDFIKNNHNEKAVELYNIDFHHDILNDNPSLDCGNWIKFLMQSCRIEKFRWIARKKSVKMYGFTEDEIAKMHILFDFEQIKDMQFDAISICRSDPWTPPHLDWYFNHLLELSKSKFKNIKAEPAVTKPRRILGEYPYPEEYPEEQSTNN